MKEEYHKGPYQAGPLKAAHVDVAAGSYYKGQLLSHATSSTDYVAYNASASDGTEIPRAIFFKGDYKKAVVLTAKQKALVLVNGTEYLTAGLRDGSGNGLSVNAALRQQVLENAGIIIR